MSKKPLKIWMEKRDIRDDIIKHIKDEMNGVWNEPTVKIEMTGCYIEIAKGKVNIAMEKQLNGEMPSCLSQRDNEFVLQWSMLNFISVMQRIGFKVEGLHHFDKLLENPKIKKKTPDQKLEEIYDILDD